MQKLVFSASVVLLTVLAVPPASAYDCPRGDAAFDRAEMDRAVQAYSTCLSSLGLDDDDKRDLFIARGDSYVLLGQFVDANLDYQVGLAFDRESPEIFLRLSRLSALQEEHADAVRHATQAISLDSESVEGRRLRAFSRIAQGFMWQAFEDLGFVLQHRSGDHEVRLARAEVLHAIGESEEALEEIAIVLESEPENTQGLRLRDTLNEVLQSE